jgi:hypothetical protein
LIELAALPWADDGYSSIFAVRSSKRRIQMIADKSQSSPSNVLKLFQGIPAKIQAEKRAPLSTRSASSPPSFSNFLSPTFYELPTLRE